MRHGKGFWALPFCLGGGLSLLCFLFAFCDWCRANESGPLDWLCSRVIAVAQSLGGG